MGRFFAVAGLALLAGLAAYVVSGAVLERRLCQDDCDEIIGVFALGIALASFLVAAGLGAVVASSRGRRRARRSDQ